MEEMGRRDEYPLVLRLSKDEMSRAAMAKQPAG
jgi:hypothetical protein